MRNRPAFVLLAAVMWTGPAAADDLRVHVTAGAAHAVGPPQQREFGPGGGGAVTVELPVGSVLGVQAAAGGLVLARGAPPADSTFASKSTGAAFLGTLGVRVHPLGASRVAGPWIDASGGIAQTGGQTRVALETHLGWDFRVARASRLDAGPFVGFTQIVQPDSALRPDDARVIWLGLAVSLGARDAPPRAAPSPDHGPEQQATALPEDSDGIAEVYDLCPAQDGTDADKGAPEGCPSRSIALVDDRIMLDDVIHFDFDSPRIRHESFGLVWRVARFIRANPSLTEVSIEGHADAQGSDEYNQQLSEERAKSTMAMLVHFGVDAARLRVVGHGESKLKISTPLADPRNRRVEFVVKRSRDVASAPPSPRSPAPVISAGKRGRS